MRTFGLVVAAGLLAVLLGQAAKVESNDWPRWCGPSGNCTTAEKGLLDKWPEAGPKELWRKNVGIGYASPVAVGGKVYAFGTVGGKDTLTCLKADSGEVVWEQKSAVGYTGGYPGTRATPAIEGEFIYTFGGMGDLICRKLADGTRVWATEVLKETGARPLQWGSASCPTILGDLVLVQTGDGGPIAVAVHQKDGKIAWQSEAKGKGSYAAVGVIDVGGAKQVVSFGGMAAVGMDPKTGKTLWTQAWKTNYDINAVTPVYHDGHLFLTSGYGVGCAMFKFDGKKTEELWRQKEPHDHQVPVLLENGTLYVTNEGGLLAMKWPAKDILWNVDLKLGLGGQFVRFGDKMVMLGDRGEMILAQVTPKGCEVISKFQAFQGKEVWASPIVHAGKLYAKGPTELVCWDVKGK